MKARIACLAIALLSVMLSGCTAIGFGVGLSMDAKNAKSHRASWTETRSIPQEREVDVALTSGDTLCGKFTGLRALPPDSYRSLYDSARTRLAGDSVLPPLGEVVFVVPWNGRPFSGKFLGFEAEALVIRRSGDDTLTFQPPTDIARLKKYYGRTYDIGRLCDLASERALPSRREFTVQKTGRSYSVPLQKIEQVYVWPHFTTHALAGAAAGLVVDAAVAALAYWVFEQPTHSEPGGGIFDIRW
jgi:hypothetical protein